MELHDLEPQSQITFEQVMIYARELNQTLAELRDVNRNLKEAYLDTIHRLAIAAEYRDGDTGAHIIRIGAYSKFVAEKLGVPKDMCETIGYAAPMHDIGKIGIPDSILQKNGQLTNDEWEVIKQHPMIGARILSGSGSSILQCAEIIALSHHERWDGTGYPNKLAREDIPLEGRIVAIVDVFDALRSTRPYKVSINVEQATRMIFDDKGKHFDPEIVDVFMESIGEIESLHLDNISLPE